MPKYGILTETDKWCNGCKVFKPFADFNKAKKTASGLQVFCKPCAKERSNIWRKKNLQKCAERQKTNRLKNPERYKDYWRKQHYGIEQGVYDKLFAAQKGLCAICDTNEPGGAAKGLGGFHVDHCHSTKTVRGLLCNNCNFGLGQFKDKPELLQSAIDYLTKTRTECA